jgi:hypothetical protein
VALAGHRVGHMWAIMASPKAEVLSLVAPSISRWKS